MSPRNPIPVTHKSGPHAPSILIDVPPLPDVPSALLELALKDLAAAEQSPLYRVDMSSFHRPENGLCSVCLAGALLTRYIGPRELCSHPEGMFDKDTALKLLAVDQMRTGLVRSALRIMGVTPVPQSLVNREVTRYDNDPEKFRADMAQMIIDLKCVLL